MAKFNIESIMGKEEEKLNKTYGNQNDNNQETIYSSSKKNKKIKFIDQLLKKTKFLKQGSMVEKPIEFFDHDIELTKDDNKKEDDINLDK